MNLAQIDNNNLWTCSICLCTRCDDVDKRVVMVACGNSHFFHNHCILEAQEINLSCPLCRRGTSPITSVFVDVSEEGEPKLPLPLTRIYNFVITKFKMSCVYIILSLPIICFGIGLILLLIFLFDDSVNGFNFITDLIWIIAILTLGAVAIVVSCVYPRLMTYIQ